MARPAGRPPSGADPRRWGGAAAPGASEGERQPSAWSVTKIRPAWSAAMPIGPSLPPLVWTVWNPVAKSETATPLVWYAEAGAAAHSDATTAMTMSEDATLACIRSPQDPRRAARYPNPRTRAPHGAAALPRAGRTAA